jgi:hypothetical protein
MLTISHPLFGQPESNAPSLSCCHALRRADQCPWPPLATGLGRTTAAAVVAAAFGQSRCRSADPQLQGVDAGRSDRGLPLPPEPARTGGASLPVQGRRALEGFPLPQSHPTALTPLTAGNLGRRHRVEPPSRPSTRRLAGSVPGLALGWSEPPPHTTRHLTAHGTENPALGRHTRCSGRHSPRKWPPPSLLAQQHGRQGPRGTRRGRSRLRRRKKRIVARGDLQDCVSRAMKQRTEGQSVL